jgi:hypothetical protein
VKLHFSADIRLTRQPVERPTVEFSLPCADGQLITSEMLYRTYFHGPAYRVVESVRICSDQAIGLLPVELLPDTDPENVAHQMQARLIELCFQTAGAWELTLKNRMALPTALASVTVFPLAEGIAVPRADRRIYALVEVVKDGESFDAQVVDDCGDIYLRLKGYRTIGMGG